MSRAVLVQECQIITRAQLRAALSVLQKKHPGVKLHLVTDRELVYLGYWEVGTQWPGGI